MFVRIEISVFKYLLIRSFQFIRAQELEMSVKETSKKTGAPQIVKLDKALKLVNNFYLTCHM